MQPGYHQPLPLTLLSWSTIFSVLLSTISTLKQMLSGWINGSKGKQK
jgi:hypothetical protein